MMRRREVITLLGGAAAWPLAARAQQAERVRRVGVLVAGAENDQTVQAYIAAFRDGLAKLGWVEARNLRIDLRFGGDDPDRFRAYGAELVSLASEVMITDTAATTRSVLSKRGRYRSYSPESAIFDRSPTRSVRIPMPAASSAVTRCCAAVRSTGGCRSLKLPSLY